MEIEQANKPNETALEHAKKKPWTESATGEQNRQKHLGLNRQQANKLNEALKANQELNRPRKIFFP